MFDPASFFGHSEFELAIMDMFGGFQEPFWTAYHAKVRAGTGCVCVRVCFNFGIDGADRLANENTPVSAGKKTKTLSKGRDLWAPVVWLWVARA